MIQHDDEKKYEDVIRKLKNLSTVNAPDYFEADLKRRIENEETSGKKSFWDKLILPSRLIPSAGLAAAAMIIFFMITLSPEEMDNPFLIEPKLREDIIEISSVEGYLDKDEVRTDVGSKEKSVENPDAGKRTQESVGETKSGRDEPTMMMKKENVADDKLIAETDAAETESTLTDSMQITPATVIPVETASGMAITKQELNFRQVQLNAQEQQVVDELRNKMQLNEQKKVDYQK